MALDWLPTYPDRLQQTHLRRPALAAGAFSPPASLLFVCGSSTATDQSILSEVQYAVIEPADGGQIWPSGLWTRDEVLGYLNQRQDKFQKETLIFASEATISGILHGTRRIPLPADWIRTISVVWYGSDGTVRELTRGDEFETDTMIPTWEQATGTPLAYHEFEAPNLEIEIAPSPALDGSLHLLYIAAGTSFNGNGVAPVLPDELAHALKYGVLADLLAKDGRGKDPARAQYAAERYQLAIDLSRIILEGWS